MKKRSLIIVAGALIAFCCFLPVLNNAKGANYDLFNITYSDVKPIEYDYMVFIAANRDIQKQQNGIQIGRGINPTHHIQYFMAFVKNEQMTLVSSNLEENFNYLNPEKQTVIFVHGHGKTLDKSVKRAAEISELYNVNVVLFEWPTDNLTLGKSKKYARKVAGNFGAFILEYHDYNAKYGFEKPSLFMHSLGNLLMKDFIVASEITSGDKYFKNVIFNAPAVSSRNHARWVESINMQDRIYVLLSGNDFVLRGAQLLSLRKQLGNEIVDRPASNAQYVYFEKEGFKEHSYFLVHRFKNNEEYVNKINDQHIVSFYSQVFQGQEVNFNNANLFSVRADGRGFNLAF